MHPRSAIYRVRSTYMVSIDGSQGDSSCVDCGVGFHLPRGSVGNTTHGSRILVRALPRSDNGGFGDTLGQPWLVSTSMVHMRFTKS